MLLLLGTQLHAAKAKEDKGDATSDQDDATFKVSIKTHYKTFDLYLNEEQTIKEIKQQIKKKEGIDVEKQSLLLYGDKLDDDKEVGDYDIEAEDTIHLMVPLGQGIGGVTFSNFKEKNKVSFSDKAPDWRVLNVGLNLEGLCQTKKCKAFGKKVWVQKGIGKFNMAKEVVMSPCPMCKKSVKNPEVCGFFYCKYTIEGKEEGKEFFKKTGQHKSNKGFEKFEGGGDKSTEYIWLEITTEKHKETPKF